MNPTTNAFNKKSSLNNCSLSTPPFCPIFDNESIYSWCARLHRLYGQPTALKTCRLLFEHNNAGLCHDFPRKLSTLIKHTGRLYSPRALLTEHTALGSYKAFLTRDKFNEAVSSALTGKHPDIKTLLGGNHSGALYPFVLKYCPECVSESLKHFGYSYWRTLHQWPSVHVCDVHNRILVTAPRGFHNKTLKKWYLPHDDSISQWSEQPDVTNNALEILLRIHNWSIYLTKYNRHPLDNHLLKVLYHLQARNHGFVNADGSLKFLQLKKAFMHQYEETASINGFEFLGDIHKGHGGMLGVILKKYSGDRFPLKQILMIDFLFESHSSFSKSYSLIQYI